MTVGEAAPATSNRRHRARYRPPGGDITVRPSPLLQRGSGPRCQVAAVATRPSSPTTSRPPSPTRSRLPLRTRPRSGLRSSEAREDVLRKGLQRPSQPSAGAAAREDGTLRRLRRADLQPQHVVGRADQVLRRLRGRRSMTVHTRQRMLARRLERRVRLHLVQHVQADSAKRSGSSAVYERRSARR